MIKKFFIRGQAFLLSFVLLFVIVLSSIGVSASTANTGMRNISALDLVKDIRLGFLENLS